MQIQPGPQQTGINQAKAVFSQEVIPKFVVPVPTNRKSNFVMTNRFGPARVYCVVSIEPFIKFD